MMNILIICGHGDGDVGERTLRPRQPGYLLFRSLTRDYLLTIDDSQLTIDD